MKKRISNWLLRSDEKLLAAIKDDHERTKYLTNMYRTRTAHYLLLWAVLILNIIGIFWIPDVSTAPFLLGLVLVGLGYLDIDSKIRAVRFYELSSAMHKSRQ